MMLCDNPFVGRAARPFGCGQCLPCRINRRRQWAARMVLESTQHAENSFATLTYSDDHLPRDGSVSPRVVQLFIKKLRERLRPKTFRFFLVGEYGEKSQRPHYHLCLFGVQPTALVPTQCPFTCAVADAWGLGFVKVDPFHSNRASYCARYVVKKMTAQDDPRLEGRHPEFARMSRMPGLGHAAMLQLAAQINNSGGVQEWMLTNGDVPGSMRHEGRTITFSRYLLEKLRESVGFTDEYIAQVKEEKSAQLHGEVLTMLEAAIYAQEPEWVPTVKSVWLRSNAVRRAQVKGRYELRKGPHRETVEI